MIFPNTTYLTFFTHNLALNRYSFLTSTAILIILALFHIIKLCARAKMSETPHASTELTVGKKSRTELGSKSKSGSPHRNPSNGKTPPQIPDSSANITPITPNTPATNQMPEWKSVESHSNGTSNNKIKKLLKPQLHKLSSKSISNSSNKSIIGKIIKMYKKGKQGKFVVISQLMTISTLLFFIGHGIIDTLDFYGIFHGILSCTVVRVSAAMLWHNGKTSMYFIFYSRLQLAFSDTYFEYSSKTMNSLLLLIWSLWLTFMIGDILEVHGKDVYHEQYDIHWCQQLVPRWGCIAVPVFDGFISLLCLYLFIAPLCKIMEYCNHFDEQSVSVIIKYTWLTFVCIITTTIVLILIIFKSWGILFTFDVIINSVSVMMMTKDYHKYYAFLCGHCGHDICIQHYIISKADKAKHLRNKPNDTPTTNNDNFENAQTEVIKIEMNALEPVQTTSDVSTKEQSSGSRAYKSIGGIPIEPAVAE